MVFFQDAMSLVPQFGCPHLREPGPRGFFYFPLRMRLFKLEYEPRPILGSECITFSDHEVSVLQQAASPYLQLRYQCSVLTWDLAPFSSA